MRHAGRASVLDLRVPPGAIKVIRAVDGRRVDRRGLDAPAHLWAPPVCRLGHGREGSAIRLAFTPVAYGVSDTFRPNGGVSRPSSPARPPRPRIPRSFPPEREVSPPAKPRTPALTALSAAAERLASGSDAAAVLQAVVETARAAAAADLGVLRVVDRGALVARAVAGSSALAAE